MIGAGADTIYDERRGMNNLSSNVISFWPLTESDKNSDVLGGNDLTIQNGVSYVRDLLGNVIDIVGGDNDYLELTSNSGVEVGDNEFTLTGFFELDSLPSSNDWYLINKNGEYGVYIDASTHKITFYMQSQTDGLVEIVDDFVGAISTNTFYFVAASYRKEKGGYIELQVNSGIPNRVSVTDGPALTNNVFTLATNATDLAAHTMDGQLGDFSLSKPSLRLRGIQLLYNKGNGKEPPF